MGNSKETEKMFKNEEARRVGAPKQENIVNDSRVAKLITKLVNRCNKSQGEIASEAGFEKTNIITMIKTGRTKFPVRRTASFAEAVGCDSYWLLEQVLEEYMPEVLEIINQKYRKWYSLSEKELSYC